MARQAREVSGTGIYHVMMRGINRQNIFEDEEDYTRFLELLLKMVCPVDDNGRPLPSRCTFYAYCLMTNHVHLLIRDGAESLAEVIKRIGALTRGLSPCEVFLLFFGALLFSLYFCVLIIIELYGKTSKRS